MTSEAGAPALPSYLLALSGHCSVYKVEGGVGVEEAARKSFLQEVHVNCRSFPGCPAEKGRNPELPISWGWVPASPRWVWFPRHPTCLPSASTCQSSFSPGLDTSLKAAAEQSAPIVPRGGRVWILNPRGQSVARRLL